jgi:tyrosine-protein kinase Etk/Wzc
MATETSQPDLKKHAETVAATHAIASHNDEISLIDLLIVLAERKRIILWVTVVFVLLAIVASLLLPKRYTATVSLLPPQQNTSMSAALASQVGNLGGMAAIAGSSLGIKSPNEMIVSMLKSRTVEEAMVQHFGLMQQYHTEYVSDARKIFERRATVDGSGKDGLIRISVDDPDPRRAAELANGYVDQFRDLSQHMAITEASQRRLFFEKQLIQAKDNLASAEEALKVTEQTTGLISLDSQARALIESAATLRAQIAAREVEIQGMQTYATSENAQLVQAQRELDSMRAQLAKLGSSEDSASGGIIVPKGKVPQAGLEYIRKLRDVKYNETIFDILARQFEVAKLDEAKQGSVIQVVDPAVPPDRRSFPKRTLIVLGSVFVGLFFGILAALAQAGVERMKADPGTREKLAVLRRAI